METVRRDRDNVRDQRRDRSGVHPDERRRGQADRGGGHVRRRWRLHRTRIECTSPDERDDHGPSGLSRPDTERRSGAARRSQAGRYRDDHDQWLALLRVGQHLRQHRRCDIQRWSQQLHDNHGGHKRRRLNIELLRRPRARSRGSAHPCAAHLRQGAAPARGVGTRQSVLRMERHGVGLGGPRAAHRLREPRRRDPDARAGGPARRRHHHDLQRRSGRRRVACQQRLHRDQDRRERERSRSDPDRFARHRRTQGHAHARYADHVERHGPDGELREAGDGVRQRPGGQVRKRGGGHRGPCGDSRVERAGHGGCRRSPYPTCSGCRRK